MLQLCVTSENSYEPVQPSMAYLNDSDIFVLHLPLPEVDAESTALVIWSGFKCCDGESLALGALLLAARRDCELMKTYGSSNLSNAQILCIQKEM